MNNKRMFFYVILIILISFFMKMLTINYPIIGDSTLYVELTENLVKSGDYISPIYSDSFKPHTTVPPLYPLFSAVLDMVINNSVYSIKVINIIFSSLTLLIIFMIMKRLRFSNKLNIITVLLVLFNPLFFYYTGTLALTEGMAAFFLTFSFYLYLIKEDNFVLNILAGVCFGLTALIRVPMIFILSPFLLYELIKILKNTKNVFKNLENIKNVENIENNNIIENKIIESNNTAKCLNYIKLLIYTNINSIVFIVLSIIPGIIWLLRNLYHSGTVLPSKYAELSATQSSFSNLTIMLPKMVLISLPLIFLFLLPFVVYGMYHVFKKGLIWWKLLIYGFFIDIALISWFSVGFAVPRTRFIILFVPLFTILSVIYLSQLDLIRKKYITYCYAIILTIFVVMTCIINFGYIKDMSDKIIKIPAIYPQESYHRSLSINWINEHSPKNSLVLQTFSDKANRVNIDQSLGYYFRKDIQYYQTLPPEKGFKKEVSRTYLEEILKNNPTYLLNKVVYIMSDYDEIETKNRLKHLPFKFEIKELFRTKYPPFSYVYKMIVH